MALSPKAVASWGLLSDEDGGAVQVIQEMEMVVAAAEPLAVELETEAIIVKLRDDQ
jgi:hypothetical protein